MRSKVAALVAALVAVALHAPPASAVVSTPIVAVPGSYMTSFATPIAVTTVGGDLTFANTDVQFHDVVSVAFGPDDQPWCGAFPEEQCPLLWSEQVALGATTQVHGTENLVAGEVYDFYCQPHTWMTGRLVVAG